MIRKIIAALALLLLPISSHAAVVFEDNFDGFTSGWTRPLTGDGMKFFPWTTGGTFAYENNGVTGGGGYGSLTQYAPSIYAPSEQNNNNSWNGWRIANESGGADFAIVTGEGVSNTPCIKITYPVTSVWNEDIGICKWLGNVNYQELYVRFRFKYSDNWRWHGSVLGGDPVSGNVLWKQMRIWTGFNAIDYGKSGGQSQPVENTTLSDESNWRCGIWVPRLMFSDWGESGKVFISESDYYWPASGCASSCDSQTCTRGSINDNCNIIDWATSSSGQLNTYLNSGGQVNSDGSFTDPATWHTIEYHYKNNSFPGAGDGAFELYIDGVLATSPSVDTGVKASMSADPDDYGMNFVQIMGNHAYLTTNNSAPQSLFIDDVVISTTYVGPDYIIGTPSTAPTVTISTLGGTVTSTPQTVTGTATATAGRTIASVTCPGQTVTPVDGAWDEISEAWTCSASLAEGSQTLTFTATDSAAETGTDSVQFTLNTPAPTTASTQGAFASGCVQR